MSNELIEKLRPALLRMSNSPVLNYATPGLTSMLIGGNGHGTVRLFRSDRSTRHEITPHSHRFDFTCLVLRGTVHNIIFQCSGGLTGDWFARAVLRPKDGGMGGYEVDRGDRHSVSRYVEVPTVYQAGDVYSMRSHEIHSIRFSSDAEVLFFEGPQVAETSVILEPYSNGEVVQTFKTEEWMFKR